MKNVLVIGMGRFGHHLAEKLQELGNDVMIIDRDADLVNKYADEFTDSYIGDCTNEAVIRSIDVKQMDLCFVSIGEDFQSSLMITSLLKEAGAKFVVAKASQGIQEDILRRIGADEVVCPEREIAEKLAVRFNANNIFDYVPLTGDYSIYELPIPLAWQRKSISDLQVCKKYKVNIVAIKNGTVLQPTPEADYVFRAEDHIIVIGKSADVFKLSGKRKR